MTPKELQQWLKDRHTKIKINLRRGVFEVRIGFKAQNQARFGDADLETAIKQCQKLFDEDNPF